MKYKDEIEIEKWSADTVYAIEKALRKALGR